MKTVLEHNLYQVGGSLSSDIPTYVVRRSDDELYRNIKVGNFCYVLSARQMGKSSMRVRTMEKLRNEGYQCISFELTQLGNSDTNAKQWYYSFLYKVASAFNLTEELKEWWKSKIDLTPVARFYDFMEHILLKRVSGKIVIFLDEIDSLLSIDKEIFNTDDFFAGIRSFFNERAENEDLRRLNFVIIGTATPNDLINDAYRTPFNIGVPIQMEYFTLEEAKPLAEGFKHIDTDIYVLLAEIIYWTGGQPVLTQKLCYHISANETSIPNPTKTVEDYVTKLFLQPQNNDEDNNILNVSTRLVGDSSNSVHLLGTYLQVYRGAQVVANNSDTVHLKLKLSGIVLEKKGVLTISCPIYKERFNDDWVVSELQKAERPFAKEMNIWLRSKKQYPYKIPSVAIDNYYKWSLTQQGRSGLEHEFMEYLLQNDRSEKSKKLRSKRFYIAAFVSAILVIGFLGIRLIELKETVAKQQRIIKSYNNWIETEEPIKAVTEETNETDNFVFIKSVIHGTVKEKPKK